MLWHPYWQFTNGDFIPPPTPVIRQDEGGHKKERKHKPRSLFDLEFPDVPRETLHEQTAVVEVKKDAHDLSEKIVEAHSEISRIRTQMRLQSNDAALQTMEREIKAIEAHLKKIKTEHEDTILTLLM